MYTTQFGVFIKKTLIRNVLVPQNKPGATVSGLNDMFPGNGVQQGLRYVFSFGGYVKNVSPISSNMYINHVVLKRLGPSEVLYTVSAAARYTQQLQILEDMFVMKVS